MSCHPWVQQLRADMKALWALSPTARQSLPSPEGAGMRKQVGLSAAENERVVSSGWKLARCGKYI